MRAIMIGCAALALAMGACGGDGGSGGDTSVTNTTATDTSGDTGTATSTTDADATTSGDTAQPFACTTAADCAETGAICSCEGECVVPELQACTEDRNCGVPRWCNACTGHCEVQQELCDPCQESRGCRDGGACIPYQSGGSYCGLSCLSDAGCPKGYSCLDVAGADDKQCVAKSGSCEDLGLCESDGECPGDNAVCNAGTGECAPGCADDESCPSGNVCQRGRCVEPCTGDGDCTAPALCDTSVGKCKVPGACEVGADCPEPATYCDKVAGTCRDGCLVDNDCKDASKKCEQRQCVPKGCSRNADCGFEEVCNKTNGQCEPTTEPHCAPCGESPGAQACDEPNLCATFQDEDENPLGDFCLLTCKDDPIDKCPQGYACQEIDMGDGSAPSYLCVRECYYSPVGGN